MLYTPILVDRMQLTFPSGFAVANILRALTDKRILKRSIAQAGRRHRRRASLGGVGADATSPSVGRRLGVLGRRRSAPA